jgi:cell division protein FtsQ
MPRAPSSTKANTGSRILRSAAVPAPADVRLMNQVASLLLVVVGLIILALVMWWLVRSPLFPIRGIHLDGELARNSVPTIRAGVHGPNSPQLAGNFFSVDLERGRAAFEAVPWVRKAVVRRVWPDHLAVRLEEHHAAAYWESAQSAESASVNQDTDKLVNSFGEVFQANVGDVEEDGLPVLTGPEGAAAKMLALLQRLQPVFARLDTRSEVAIDKLTLSGRGSWRAELDNGAVIELGRGSEEELLARSERFVRTLAQATAQYTQQPLEYADLRHADGYALRLRGVSTTSPSAAPVPGTAAAPVKTTLAN